VLAPDLLGLRGPALRKRRAELGDESVGFLRLRSRQGGEVGVDLGGERVDLLGVLTLGPVEEAAGDLLERGALRARRA